MSALASGILLPFFFPEQYIQRVKLKNNLPVYKQFKNLYLTLAYKATSALSMELLKSLIVSVCTSTHIIAHMLLYNWALRLTGFQIRDINILKYNL